VTHLLGLIVEDCVKKASRYPSLRDSTRNVLKSLVGYSMRETQEHIRKQIEFQKSKINDQYEDFHQYSELMDPIKPIPLSSIASEINSLVRKDIESDSSVGEFEDASSEPTNYDYSTANLSHQADNDLDNDYLGKVKMIESYSKILKKFFK